MAVLAKKDRLNPSTGCGERAETSLSHMLCVVVCGTGVLCCRAVLWWLGLCFVFLECFGVF